MLLDAGSQFMEGSQGLLRIPTNFWLLANYSCGLVCNVTVLVVVCGDATSTLSNRVIYACSWPTCLCSGVVLDVNTLGPEGEGPTRTNNSGHDLVVQALGVVPNSFTFT